MRREGHEAWFVGGCVRDERLGREPKEYDVATSAVPDEVERIFPRSIPVGKSFGVIRVLDDVTDGVITEVATFRADDAYIDGRRPTGVRFTTVEEDAARRDFTVNGLFLDPETGEIRDYVGGLADIDARVLRAIGEPRARFREDKLRLLRAVRFAATGPFEIDPETWSAVVEMAPEITVVSWERIREELFRILTSGRSAHGFRLLRACGLLRAILPEMEATVGVAQPPEFHPEGDVWVHTLLALEHFDRSAAHTVEMGLAVLLHDVGKPPTFRIADRIRFDGHDRVGAEMAGDILRRLKCSNELIEEVQELVARHMAFTQIRDWREAKVRRFLGSPRTESHLELHRLDCLAAHGKLDVLQWCRTEQARYAAEPPKLPRLISGDDLLAAGYVPGRGIGKVLASVDDERLEGRLTSREEAIRWALLHFPPPSGDAACAPA
ncbi:MAG: CCA tRNA nucleotidyltransferase [Planctomycetes bacterium]|nr:CCA tRNA nucleotidyltransferase [Planctomycetota bacterium]